MANIDRPNGFRPHKDSTGKPYNGQMVKMNGATNLFLGDAVIAHTAGAGKYQSCTRATAGDGSEIILGVVVGWDANPDGLSDKYYTASDDIAVYICTDPDMSYVVQGDGAGTVVITSEDIGKNLDFVIAAGSTTTGASNMEVDESVTGVTTVGTPLHLLGLLDSPDNAETANVKCVVKFNMHAYGVLDGMTTGV